MEQHLSFYPQYQPSFDADQSKIDEFALDSLNTPDINPEFFIDQPFFPKVGANSLMGGSSNNVSLGKMAIKSDDDYMVFPDLGLNQSVSMAAAASSAFDRTTYSPYAEDSKQQQQQSHHHNQLDSASININSPEMMMPVSPNKVCPQLDGYDLLDAAQQQQQQQQFSQMSDYESMVNFDYHHNSSPSTSNSRSSSISAGSDTYLSEYILSDPAAHLMTGSVDPSLCRVPHSPAASISSYSSESSTSNKKYIQLETVQHQQPQIVIKQEPVDSLYPTVVEEYEYQTMPALQQQQQAPVSSYSTINTNDLSYYYPTNALPSTVSSAIQMQTVVQAVPTTVTPTTSNNGGNNRKRNSATAFASTSTSQHHQSATSGSSTSTSGSSKKPRMTKREKQKLMEGDISKYENENKELRNSIDLLERQIQFCKRFLSENVAPVIQRQQMQSHSHFGPNQSQLVAIALESQ